MREIRSYGSEGGGTDWFSLPLSTVTYFVTRTKDVVLYHLIAKSVGGLDAMKRKRLPWKKEKLA
jgi:hypothetical protein